MKTILRELIHRFYQRAIPEPIPRTCRFPVVEGRATILLGMRRNGKTYRCYQRMHELLESGISHDRLLYINFEDERLKGFKLEDFQLILDAYYEFFPDNRDVLCYFFFDEIQNVPEWELFIRRAIDSEKIQFALTGSSSKMLVEDMATAMRGRSMTSEVMPFSLEEFIRFHHYLDQVPEYIGAVEKSIIQHALNEYFQWGGMPEIQKTEEPDRDLALQEQYLLVVSRDVKERYNIRNNDAVDAVAQFMFNSVSERISISGILDHLNSRGIKSDWESVKNYIKYLCDAFLFFPVEFEDRSLTRQKKNPVKYYAADIGLVRSMSLNPGGDRGHLLENLVFLHLHRTGWRVTYVVTQSGGKEIDFLAYHSVTKKKQLVQVAYSLDHQATLEREVSAFNRAADYLEAGRRLLVTWDDENELPGGIQVIPAWKFLLDRY
jgi:predicted AAA+ superfamily ATPase